MRLLRDDVDEPIGDEEAENHSWLELQTVYIHSLPWDHNAYIVKNRANLLFLDVRNDQEGPDVIGLRDDKDRNEIEEGDVESCHP